MTPPSPYDGDTSPASLGRKVWLPLFVLSLLMAMSASAQQAVRIKVDGGNDLKFDIPAQLYRPAAGKPAPAVAIFHGCGGVGQNNTRMAELLKSWGYVALVVDSFSSRGLKDVCGRNWPTQSDAETRALDIDATGLWLNTQEFVKPSQHAFMGYSYGGGVGLLRALSARTDIRVPSGWRAAVLVYPDCALGEAIAQKLRPRLPTLIAMGALDDWTPVKQCEALLDRIVAGRELIETR